MLIRHPLNFLHRSASQANVDPSPLIISSGPTADNVTSSGATISWSLNRPATGQVHYGLTTAYGGTTTAESSYDYQSHTQTISGLSAGMTYHYKVVGQDELGNAYDSGDNTFVTTGAASGGYPTPSALVFSSTVQTTAPGYLSSVTCGNHGTEISRIGENHLDRNLYSSVAAWNRDGSLCALYWGSSHSHLFDTTTTPWTRRSTAVVDFANDMSWDDEDPLRFYRHYGNNAFRRYIINPTNGSTTVDQTWSVGGGSDLLIGGWQGQMGGGYIPYTFNSHSAYGCLEIATGDYWEVTTGSGAVDAVFVTHDGATFIVVFNSDGSGSEQGTWAMSSADHTSNKRQLSRTQDHCDTATLANGDQVFVMGSTSSDGVSGSGATMGYWNLDDNDSWTKVLDYWPSGHISGRCFDRPGYVYISNELAWGTTNYAGRQDIFALNLDDPPASGGNVEYFAKAHAVDPRRAYQWDPMACVSPDGSLVVWSVPWDGSDECFAYVAGVQTGMT